MFSLRDARTGLATRAEHGPPPDDLTAFIAWVEDRFRLLVRWSDALPPGSGGAYRAVPDGGDVTGVILLRPDVPHPRWVLAHELGHALTGCRAGYFLWADGHYHSNLTAERAANACAAALLLDIAAIRDRLYADWTVSRVAAKDGVPVAAIIQRMDLATLLGEYRPERIEAHMDALALGQPPT
jgi:hypothetical protein